MISWKNPTAADRDLGMDDYLRLGLVAALDAVSAIVPGQRVHTVGYCIGGTLLAIGAAALARPATSASPRSRCWPRRPISASRASSRYSSPRTSWRRSRLQMQRDGVLSSESMGAAFALLRASDLIWAPAVNQYLRGQRGALNDLMAWNADGTRMPCRMHGEYLSRLYLHNELSAGRFTVDGASRGPGSDQAADVRGRHRDRSCGAVALGVQDRRADALARLHLPADQRRPQRRASSAARSTRSAGTACATGTSATTARPGADSWRARRAARGLVVAELAAMAREAIPRRATWPPPPLGNPPPATRRWPTPPASTCAAKTARDS